MAETFQFCMPLQMVIGKIRKLKQQFFVPKSYQHATCETHF